MSATLARFGRFLAMLLLPGALLVTSCGGGGGLSAPACEGEGLTLEGNLGGESYEVAEGGGGHALDQLSSPASFTYGSSGQPTLELTWSGLVANGASAELLSGVVRDGGGQVICAGSGQVQPDEGSVSFTLGDLSLSSDGSCPGEPVAGSLAGCVDISSDF